MLSDAVLAVAEAMEQHCKEDPNGATIGTASLRSYARELRTAVKAAEGPQNVRIHTDGSIPPTSKLPPVPKPKNPEADPVPEIKVLNGGKQDGLHVPISSSMPIGATIGIFGECYTKGQDGQLFYDEGETQKMLERQAKEGR